MDDDDDSRIRTTATLVALAGGVIAFFALTRSGRQALRQVGPALDNVWHALDEVRAILRSFDRMAQEARGTVDDIRDAMPSVPKDD